MLEQYFRRPEILQGHRDGLFGPYLDAVVSVAGDRGYRRETIRRQCWVIRDLGRWLEQNNRGVVDLDDALVRKYLKGRKRMSLVRSSGGAGLRLLLGYLRDLGVVALPEEVAEASPIEQLKRRYERYLKRERGLAPATLANYLPIVDRFLAERFAEEPLRVEALDPSDITDFVLRNVPSMARKRAKLMVSALRSFLRFLFKEGEIARDLAACVPSVADWRLATVPMHLSAPEIERVLEACDRGTAIGRRDYAILLLLVRLGLRAGEIVALQLDDVNWRAGEIVVRGKGNLHDRLPMVQDVGEALAAYVHRDRPRCQSRSVFIRSRAPISGLGSSPTVSTLVRRALERAGLNPPTKGAHLLRHSLATGMLRRGASMAEIGEVLRHRSPQTTEIYTKVDVVGLRTLAQAWPGSGGGR